MKAKSIHYTYRGETLFDVTENGALEFADGVTMERLAEALRDAYDRMDEINSRIFELHATVRDWC